jgi:replicative DNA helicase
MKRQRDPDETVAAEEALIGSAILQPGVLDRIAGLEGKDFSDPALGQFWDLLLSFRDQGTPVDDLVMIKGPAAAIGIDAARLARLYIAGPIPDHARYYADGVQEAARIRALADLARLLSESVSDRLQSSAAILSQIEAAVDSLRSDQKSRAVSLATAGRELLAELNQPTRGRTIAFGLPVVDETIGGMMPGEMFVLAARPGCGKTSLGMQVALHNARRARSVLFVSLEMRKSELASRVLVGMTGVDSAAVRARLVTNSDGAKLGEAVGKLDDLPMTILDPTLAKLGDIRRSARAQQAASGLDLLVVDYLSLVKPVDHRQPRYEQVSEISRSIKGLARELGIPVLALQQLNREADGQVPRLSNLRESGSIEQDADSVVFLHPTDDVGGFDLIIAKHRHGQTGRVPLEFDAKRTTFREPAARSWSA